LRHMGRAIIIGMAAWAAVAVALYFFFFAG
jgi:hypothetical protein